MKKFKLSEKHVVSIGIWMIIIGIGIIGSNYFMTKKYEAFERITFELSNIPKEIISEVETPDEEIMDAIITTDVDTGKTVQTYNANVSYVGRIEIPKISLIKGFVSKESSDNNVDKNVAIILPCDYPDVSGGNFILAAHTGNTWNSFFKNLYKLEINDTAYIYYDNIKYTYTMVNKYDEKKTGVARIYRDTSKTSLTLITCKKGTKDLQTIFIFELSTIEKI